MSWVTSCPREMLLSAPAAFRQRREVCRFLLPHCSHYNTVPPGKACKAPEHFKEDCTEPSSQDHDIGSHHLRHQTACSSKRLGQGTLMTKSSQSESQRPAVHAEHNGVMERRRRRKPGIMTCRPDPHQNTDEKWAFTPEKKSRRRPGGRRNDGAKGYIPSSFIRPQSTHMTRQGAKPVQNRYGDTWSDSSSTPSVPSTRHMRAWIMRTGRTRETLPRVTQTTPSRRRGRVITAEGKL
nr:uncharacterized protein LOC115114468 isoform X1 [Oncorhynchus nerka]